MQRYKKIAFFRMNDIWFDTDLFLNNDDKLACLHSNTILKENEYDFVIPGKTFLLNISRNNEELIKGFEQKSCRYAIKKAERDGVVVEKANSKEEIDKYLEFENNFCKQRGIPTVSAADLAELEVFCARSKEGEYLGGCAFLVSVSDKTIRYKYGSTLHKLNANEAILWFVIKYYRDRGFAYFDLGGCVPTEDIDNYNYRHYHFKKKWGGELVDSYNYFKTKGIYRVLCIAFNVTGKVFYGGDYNLLIIHLHKLGLI